MFFNISIIVYLSKMHRYGVLLCTRLNPLEMRIDILALCRGSVIHFYKS